MVFKTVRLVSSEEAKKIAARIKNEYKLYNLAFKSTIAHNNGSIAGGPRLREIEAVRPRARLRQGPNVIAWELS